MVAFDAETGAVRWQTGNDDAGYSSPVSGLGAILFFTREGLVAVDPQKGTVRFRYPWRSRTNASVNAALPVVFGDRVFLTASYNTGAVLLEVRDNRPTRVWTNDESLSAHYATPVFRDGYLYGFHGRQEFGQSFRCVEYATGKVMWTQDGFGAGTVILAGSKLLIVRENGELQWVAASPKEFRPEGKATLLPPTVRSFPALSGGVLYVRNETTLGAWQLF
jgi:outer membrane protein assembly factor BamB